RFKSAVVANDISVSKLSPVITFSIELVNLSMIKSSSIVFSRIPYQIAGKFKYTTNGSRKQEEVGIFLVNPDKLYRIGQLQWRYHTLSKVICENSRIALHLYQPKRE